MLRRRACCSCATGVPTILDLSCTLAAGPAHALSSQVLMDARWCRSVEHAVSWTCREDRTTMCVLRLSLNHAACCHIAWANSYVPAGSSA